MDPNSPLAIVLGVLVGTLVGLAPILVVQRWWQRRDRAWLMALTGLVAAQFAAMVVMAIMLARR